MEYSVQVQKESQSLVRHMRCQYALRMARKSVSVISMFSYSAKMSPQWRVTSYHNLFTILHR